MSQQLEIVSEEPFSRLSPAERAAVFLEISKSLHYMAVVSSVVNNGRSDELEQLGNRIDRDREQLAADYSDASAEVVYMALELLGAVDENLSRTMH
jgi:hypothetical protein